MRTITEAIELQAAFSELLNTNWPEKMATAFIELAARESIPRSIIFTTSAKGNVPRKFKESFRSLDGKVIGLTRDYSALSREQVAMDKLARFHPEGFEDRVIPPVITRLNLRSTKAKNLIDSESDELVVRVYGRNLSVNGRGFVYLKLEQSGRIDLGNLHLFEDTIAVAADAPEAIDDNNADAIFSIALQGKESPVASYISEYSLTNGGEFRLSIALSDDGQKWSERKSFDFIYSNGELMQVAD